MDIKDYCKNCEAHKKRKQELQEYAESLKCDKYVHKQSCDAGCSKYACVTSLLSLKPKHYCYGKRFSVPAFNWVKQVGCASFIRGGYKRDDIDGSTPE